MRKLGILFVFAISLFRVGVPTFDASMRPIFSNAGAAWGSCPEVYSSQTCKADDDLCVEGWSNHKFFDVGECAETPTISIAPASWLGNASQTRRTFYQYYADTNGNNEWMPQGDVPACKGWKLENVQNAKKVLYDKPDGVKNEVWTANVNACFKWECDEGYESVGSGADFSCKKKGQDCTDTGGTYSGGRCTCDSDKGLEADGSEKCKCKDTDKRWDGASCVDTEAAQKKKQEEQEKQRRRQDQARKTAQQKCVDSGGEWDDATNACTCSKGGMHKKSGENVCECDGAPDYAYDAVQKTCVETENSKRKRACVDSGGIWDDQKTECTCSEQKNLKKAGSDSWARCECLNDTDFVWVPDEGKCAYTDEGFRRYWCENAIQLKAEYDRGQHTDVQVYKDNAAGQPEWTVRDGKRQCVCKAQHYEWNGQKCEMLPDVAQCLAVVGAGWSDELGRCVCKDSRPGNELVPDYTLMQCVVPKSVVAARDAVKANTARQDIEKTGAKINAALGKLPVSKWKAQDGGFNTARLVSDSVAGVVLGTAGGLIVSKVMKKNQIKGGFEDMRCTIGGQEVAEWGDLFRVGIQ